MIFYFLFFSFLCLAAIQLIRHGIIQTHFKENNQSKNRIKLNTTNQQQTEREEEREHQNHFQCILHL